MTPHHLRPERCYICGGEQHRNTTHRFWRNDDAERTLAQLANLHQTLFDPAAAYVDEYRGR